MSEISKIIDSMKKLDDCVFLAPSKLPTVLIETHDLPNDVLEFYSLCGGARIGIPTQTTPQSMEFIVLPPEQVVLANIKIRFMDISMFSHERSWDWYTIVSDTNGDFLVVDCGSQHNGYCYDGFWDSYGIIGETPIIAHSFTELLINLYRYKDLERPYWLEGKVSYGDAYDSAL